MINAISERMVAAVGSSTFKSALLLVLSLAPFSGGCSRPTRWEAVQPVTGVITHKGQPVAGAEIFFFPTDPEAPETVRPKAQSSDDGKFVAWTYSKGDGVPVGGYKVTVVRHELAVSKDTVVAKPNDLPQKYASVETTDLRVDVKEGANELPPFNL